MWCVSNLFPWLNFPDWWLNFVFSVHEQYAYQIRLHLLQLIQFQFRYAHQATLFHRILGDNAWWLSECWCDELFVDGLLHGICTTKIGSTLHSIRIRVNIMSLGSLQRELVLTKQHFGYKPEYTQLCIDVKLVPSNACFFKRTLFSFFVCFSLHFASFQTSFFSWISCCTRMKSVCVNSFSYFTILNIFNSLLVLRFDVHKIGFIKWVVLCFADSSFRGDELFSTRTPICVCYFELN